MYYFSKIFLEKLCFTLFVDFCCTLFVLVFYDIKEKLKTTRIKLKEEQHIKKTLNITKQQKIET